MADAKTFEGVTTFPSRPNASYRYKVTTQTDTLTMWLEDCATKQQWESKSLTLRDFVDESNVIPQASMTDYVSSFQKCLELERRPPNSMNADTECRCDLVAQTKDAWSLQFVLALKLFASVWRPTYAISLQPVKLEPVDILAAQLRDVQEEVKRLREEASVSSKSISDKLMLKTTQTTGSNSALGWSQSATNGTNKAAKGFIVNRMTGITFQESGTYLISLMLQHRSNGDNSFECEIQRDGAGIHTCSAGGSTASSRPYSFMVVVPIDKGQKLTVVNTSKNYIDANSTMSIALLK